MKRCVKNESYWNKYCLLLELLLIDFKGNRNLLDYKFKIKALLGCFDYISFHLDALSNEYSNISLI